MANKFLYKKIKYLIKQVIYFYEKLYLVNALDLKITVNLFFFSFTSLKIIFYSGKLGLL